MLTTREFRQFVQRLREQHARLTSCLAPFHVYNNSQRCVCGEQNRFRPKNGWYRASQRRS